MEGQTQAICSHFCHFLLRCPYMTPCCMVGSHHQLKDQITAYSSFLNAFIKTCVIPLSSQHNLRHTYHIYFHVPRFHGNSGKYAMRVSVPKEQNNLPSSVSFCTSLTFCYSLKIFICLCFHDPQFSISIFQYNICSVF